MLRDFFTVSQKKNPYFHSQNENRPQKVWSHSFSALSLFSLTSLHVLQRQQFNFIKSIYRKHFYKVTEVIYSLLSSWFILEIPFLRWQEYNVRLLNEVVSLVPDCWLLFCFLATEVESGSLTRLGSSRLLPTNLHTLQSTVSSSLNPEGIYV